MTIQIITSAWKNFQKIDKEDFTAKTIEAISMSTLIKDFNEEDKKRLLWLRDNTHKEISRPIYELDRYVDATKGTINNKNFNFGDDMFSQDKIQYYLCVAIEEISGIIYKNFKDFKIEEKINIDDESEIKTWE